jgi:DNA mismatch repair ATPase MutS
MFKDRDFAVGVNAQMCYGSHALSADLELRHVIDKMARGDEFIHDACEAALFTPLMSTEEISYRQENLRDALHNPERVRLLYEILVETRERQKKSLHFLSSSVGLSDSLNGAVGLLRIFTETLTSLRGFADDGLKAFSSEGFSGLLKMLRTELSNEFLEQVRTHMKELRDQEEMLVSARLSPTGCATGYVLRRKTKITFLSRLRLGPSFTIKEGDTECMSDMDNRLDRAICDTVSVLSRVVRYIEDFFDMLRRELAFYIGCLNLNEFLTGLGAPVCVPEILPKNREARAWRGLYDISLVIMRNAVVTGNDLETNNKRLYIITGANQGGKSTFLRSFGQAQLMAQCGMPVGAESFAAPIRDGIFTHFKKEEDSRMKSGKFDEEMDRMSEIADRLHSGSLVIFNESFSSTNEREGSEIHRQISKALIENGVEVFSVSHLYSYSAAFKGDELTQFLRAERLDGGARTFKIVPGEPLETAFGEDIYRELFGESA